MPSLKALKINAFCIFVLFLLYSDFCLFVTKKGEIVLAFHFCDGHSVRDFLTFATLSFVVALPISVTLFFIGHIECPTFKRVKSYSNVGAEYLPTFGFLLAIARLWLVSFGFAFGRRMRALALSFYGIGMSSKHFVKHLLTF